MQGGSDEWATQNMAPPSSPDLTSGHQLPVTPPVTKPVGGRLVLKKHILSVWLRHVEERKGEVISATKLGVA